MGCVWRWWGLGGLTLAIALRELGVEVEVYEQSPELGEIGAAVALAANSTRLLRRLGMGDALDETSWEPSELQFRRWDDGELIWAHPVDEWYRESSAPFYGIHRKYLQSALIDRLGTEAIRLNHRLVDVEEEADRARLEFEGGQSAFADVVVGADGIHSALRRIVTGGAPKAVFSRDIGFRGLIPVEKLPHLPDPEAIHFWVGPGAHLLHYPINDDGGIVNFLAVVDCAEWTKPTWKEPCEVQEAVDAFEGWHPAVREMVGAVEEDPAWWALHDFEPLENWTAGRVALMGDSAHAMLPHQGQGANQAMEDAVALAHLLADARHDDVDPTLRRYEAFRKSRTRRAQKYSRRAADCLHVPDGAEAEKRDAGLSTLAEDLAWIHAYDIEEELAAEGVGANRSIENTGSPS